MRLLFAAFAMLAASAPLLSPAFGQTYDDPRVVIEKLYEPYFQSQDELDWSRFDDGTLRSAGLNALYEKDREEMSEGMMGRLDFDPYVDGQDLRD